MAPLSLLLVLMLAAASSSVAAASIVHTSIVFSIVNIPVAGVKAGVGGEQRTLHTGEY